MFKSQSGLFCKYHNLPADITKDCIYLQSLVIKNSCSICLDFFVPAASLIFFWLCCCLEVRPPCLSYYFVFLPLFLTVFFHSACSLQCHEITDHINTTEVFKTPGKRRCVLFLAPPKSNTAHPFALIDELSSPCGKEFVTQSSVIVSMSPSLWGTSACSTAVGSQGPEILPWLTTVSQASREFPFSLFFF